MGKKKRPWQNLDYVFGYFGKTAKRARKAFVEYVNAGIGQGRREDLTGGGLVRSAGGWSEVKELRRQGQDHVMSDERILGDSKFVESLLSQAMSPPAAGFSVERGGAIAHENGYRMLD